MVRYVYTNFWAHHRIQNGDLHLLNGRNSRGDTALHWAVFNNRSAVVEKLISAEAKMDAANNFGASAVVLKRYWKGPELRGPVYNGLRFFFGL